MTTHVPPPSPEALLAERRWVRALARSLVSDPHRADDLEQDAWVAALGSPPRRGGSFRGWLATVMRNRVRNAWRDEGRRMARHRGSARAEATPATVDLVARAEAHRLVVTAVLRLEEPYRTSILLRWAYRLDHPSSCWMITK